MRREFVAMLRLLHDDGALNHAISCLSGVSCIVVIEISSNYLDRFHKTGSISSDWKARKYEQPLDAEQPRLPSDHRRSDHHFLHVCGSTAIWS